MQSIPAQNPRKDGNRTHKAYRYVSRRGFVLGSLGLMGAVFLPGCGGQTKTGGSSAVGTLPDKRVEIDYWHYQTGDNAKVLQKFAREFGKNYKGKIKLTPVAQGSFDDLSQKMRAAAQGGGLPGAEMGSDNDITGYYQSKIIVPIEPYMHNDKYGLSKTRSESFLPSELHRGKLPIYNNHTMDFPIGFSAFTTYWNVDALKKAGFDVPPQTWREFSRHARAVSKANGGMKAWIIFAAGENFISTLLTYGVSWIKDNRTESNFDAPEALQIIKWWKSLKDEGVMEFETPDADKPSFFASKRSAYFMDSSGYASALKGLVKNFDWDAGMPPQGSSDSGEPQRTEKFGPINDIPTTSQHQQLAGWLWLKWLTAPETHARWVSQTSYFPSTEQAAHSKTLQKYYAAFPIAGKLWKEVAPNAHILPPHPALPEVRETIAPNVINEVMIGRLKPEEGMKKLKSQADQAIHQASQKS